jgi:hypothetical protein
MIADIPLRGQDRGAIAEGDRDRPGFALLGRQQRCAGLPAPGQGNGLPLIAGQERRWAGIAVQTVQYGV